MYNMNNICSESQQIIDNINNDLGPSFCNYGYKFKCFDRASKDDQKKLFQLLKNTENCAGSNDIQRNNTSTFVILNVNDEIASYIVFELISNTQNPNEKIMYIIGSCTAVSERRKGLSILIRYAICEYALKQPDIISVCSYAMNDMSAGLLKYKFAFEYVEDVGYEFSEYVFNNYDNLYINIWGKSDNVNYINNLKKIAESLQKCSLLKNIRDKKGGYAGLYYHKYMKYKSKYNNLK